MTTAVRDEIDDLVDWQLENGDENALYVRPMFEVIEPDPKEDTDRWETRPDTMLWIDGLGPTCKWLWRGVYGDRDSYIEKVKEYDRHEQGTGEEGIWLA